MADVEIVEKIGPVAEASEEVDKGGERAAVDKGIEEFGDESEEID